MQKTIKLNTGHEIAIKENEGDIYLSRNAIESIILESRKARATKIVNRENRIISILLNGSKISRFLAIYDELNIPHCLQAGKQKGEGFIHIFLAVRILSEQLSSFNLNDSKELSQLFFKEMQKIDIDMLDLAVMGACYKYHKSPTKLGETNRTLIRAQKVAKSDRIDMIKAMSILGSNGGVDLFYHSSTSRSHTNKRL